MMKLKATTTALSYAATGVVIGLVGHSLQQQVWQATSDPIREACTSVAYKSMQDFVEGSGLRAYDTQFGLVLGDPVVCTTTQQLYQYIQEGSIAGLLLTGLKLLLQVPVTMTVVIEAGRQDNRGILLWPTLVSLLCYCLGTSVVFPSFWVVCYCLLGDNHYHNFESGATDFSRGPLALLVSLPSAVLFLMTIYLDAESEAWSICAALMGSPLLPLLPLAAWTLRPPEEVSNKEAILSAKTVATNYAILAGLSFFGWIGILLAYSTSYGITDFGKFWTEIWFSPAVRALLVEVWTLSLAWMALIASRSEWSACEALLLAPLVGPGAAVAIELASLELEKYSIPDAPVRVVAGNGNSSSKKKKKKKQ